MGAGWPDTFEIATGVEEPGHTYHGFQGPNHETTIGKMDWVFVRGIFTVTGAEIIRDAENGRHPSDHYFVSADLELT